MDRIRDYYMIAAVLPTYLEAEKPSAIPNILRVNETLNEIVLHYHEEFDIYLTKKIMGGDGGRGDAATSSLRINLLEY